VSDETEITYHEDDGENEGAAARITVARIVCPFCETVQFIASTEEEEESDIGLEFQFNPDGGVCEHLAAWRGPGDERYEIVEGPSGSEFMELVDLVVKSVVSDEDYSDLVEQAGSEYNLVDTLINIGIDLGDVDPSLIPGLDWDLGEQALCDLVSANVAHAALACCVDTYPDSGCVSGVGYGMVGAYYLNRRDRHNDG